ncbi:hypothetical protein [Planomicrobium sp. CPCC 101079]|uniref:hypothetical protein n=1 Tax=Planomicrobium sp. CPCC 101079 TaxID=2599618 RepID=UPI0011B88B6B|nr:hypothetical protein [Planomicrobium sp. CPCC 101079]TWT13144.1 hypothetical protein FQV28_03110 [Planomicrobium sp. CPCC 101079]
MKKRISRRDVPVDFLLQDYNELIVEIVTNVENNIHFYRLYSFHQSYFAFSSDHWIVIIGEDGLMETAMKTSSTERYLSEEKGYIYIGTVKEVIS